jgi:hypothetical protein
VVLFFAAIGVGRIGHGIYSSSSRLRPCVGSIALDGDGRAQPSTSTPAYFILLCVLILVV